jgi:hypothetical protein
MGCTLKELIELYRTDPLSSFQKLRYEVRVKHERMLARIAREHGDIQLRNIRNRNLIGWYNEWLDGDKVATAHALVTRLRVVFRFGALMLEDRECDRLLNTLSEARFEKTVPRDQTMTLDQVNAIRETAHHWFGWDSIALVQAFQFELLLQQKDVIGEWVPVEEPGESDIEVKGRKWLRGLRWSNIDENFILRHRIGKRQRLIEVDLRTAPMVMEELAQVAYRSASGPIVLNEVNAWPWTSGEFRRKWRIVAKHAGIPLSLTNRDSAPPGIIVGGPDRARIAQAITPRMIAYSLRTLRHN